ncbi:MAG: CCA tRNA nucleotidyltransferase [Pseudomonadota bacterium]
MGGCVRDALLGKSPLDDEAIDIDIATDRTPDDMIALFSKAGIKSIPTGIAHGTITAVCEGLVAECTTLRADVETDGRRANVAFTRDWNEDPKRRDFTINAIYADVHGADETPQLWDPCGGRDDLAARRVRFIGDAKERIKEDALRILRFFRFSARFADVLDDEGLDACAALTDHLAVLSKERVFSEMSRIFPAPRASEALQAADAAGTLGALIPGSPRHQVFAKLHSKGKNGVALSLAALWPDLQRDELRRLLKPSNAILDDYEGIRAAGQALADGQTTLRLLFHYGPYMAYQAALLKAAEGYSVAPELLEELKHGARPVLPISGKDIIAKGLAPGPQVSQTLHQFTELWLDEGAPCDQASIDALITKAIDVHA